MYETSLTKKDIIHCYKGTYLIIVKNSELVKESSHSEFLRYEKLTE